MHCEDPLPESAPADGAIIQYANGIVDFQSENCIGCGYCIAAVRLIFRASTKRITGYINARSASIASASARNRLVKTCPTGAIHFGTKKEMLELAEQRVAKLKARWLRTMTGVQPGRSVVRTLWQPCHPADQPELYHGLPKDPKIDTSVSLWKGAR